MKIVPKLTLALVVGTCAIVAVNAYFRVRREIDFFESDRASDHELIGRSIVAASAAAWRSDGEASALATVEAVNLHSNRVHVRWLSPSDRSLFPASFEATSGLSGGAAPTRIAKDDLGQPHLVTWMPLDIDGTRRGTIELSEPATVEQRFARGVFQDAALAAVAVALLSALLAFAMGQWIVGRPIRAISEKARRIGQGDFDQPLLLRSRDELADLALDVNTMCDRLRTTVMQLRHADRLATVGKLASGLAHELGTPLNVVSARAEMIAAGETSEEESKTFASVIFSAAERMTKIIRQLLQFARSGTVKKVVCDLNGIVRESVELLRPLAAKRSTRLELSTCEADTTTAADAAQLQQVMMNLVMNAVQSMPRGGVVDIRVEEADVVPPLEVGATDDSFLVVQVKDQGIGISEQDLVHVFEPFFTTKDVGEGTGLGLAVAYGIVRDHGGWIVVDSAPQRGTTFSVFLPRRALG